MAKKSRTRCDHCGNTNIRLIESNGEPDDSPDLTLLCIARVRPTDWAFVEQPQADEIGQDGLVACGHQWDPNS